MSFADWLISVAGSAGVVAFGLWLLREVIKNRLTKTVQHEFDAKLESIRADLRISEEAFKAQLRAKEMEVESIRRTAMDGMSSRQITLDKRRLEAIDQLWNAFSETAKMRGVVTWMSIIKLEACLAEAERNPKFRQGFDVFGQQFNVDKIKFGNSMPARPYVSSLAWALYAAFETLIAHCLLQMQMLRSGLNMPNLLDSETVKKMLKAALPEYSEYIEKVGQGAYMHLMPVLENRLLTELQRIATGKDSDAASIEQANAIQKEVDKLSQKSEEAKIPEVK